MKMNWRALRVAAIIAGAALLAVIPTGTLARLPSICLFKNFFGFECPGCGMGRAFSALFHGDVVAALDYNVLIIVAAPVAAGFVLRDLFVLCRKRPNFGDTILN